MRKTLNRHYFEWIYKLVYNDKYYKHLSYRELLTYLHTIEFTYILPLDENRAIDGIDLRYRFGYENDYRREDIRDHIDIQPCSVLEMMIALAFRVEEHIMDDYKYGNRTGQWFWNMIVSLGLGNMCDDNFDEQYVYEVIQHFLNRDYAPNGRGGLFTLTGCPYDARKMDIWQQFMWYLVEVIEN